VHNGSIKSSVSSGSSKKRLTTSDSGAAKKGRGSTVDDLLMTVLDPEDDGNPNDTFKQLRVREVQAREIEAKARLMEAEAISGKAKSESEIFSIQAKASLLRERKKLAEEGISQADIDSLLPLNK
jgi:uncharacterized ubiquitin-like protein YukD